MSTQSQIEKSGLLPETSRRRLLQLEEFLKSWRKEKITSAQICEITGWKDSLIRHDLWLLRKFVMERDQKSLEAGVSNGYKTKELLSAIQTASKSKNALIDESVNVCIAGLGRLGAALLDEKLFEDSRFVIKAGFDSNVNRVEILRSTFPLYPAADMNWVIRQEKIKLAVLAVADKDAQSMADRLLKAGITGIVNMTRSILTLPPEIKVENISVVNALKIVY